MFTQGMPAVFGAETAELLQQRHYPVDELVQTVRSDVWHQDEAVAGIRLHVQIDLVGNLDGC